MAALRVLLCLLAFTAVRSVAETNAHDIEFFKSITFEIKGNPGDGYELKSVVDVYQTFISERSTDSTEFVIREPSHKRVSHIKAELDDKKLSGKCINPARPATRDAFLSDDNLWIISLPRKPQRGQTLHYSYREKYADVAYLPLVAVPNVDYVKEFVVTVKHPEDVTVDFEFFFSTQDIPYRIDNSDPRQTRLEFGRINAAERLTHFPFNGFRAVVLISLAQDSNAITPTRPADFVRWYSERLPAVHPGLAEQKALLLDSLLDSAAGVWQKLDIINSFVTHNIRYMADGRYPNGLIPHEPFQVLSQRYGDCKDRAYLVRALAGLAGIKVNMAAISTEPAPQFRDIHWALYDHAICVYSEGDSSLFFDPTARYWELGDIPEPLIGQPALVLDPADPRILTVPIADTFPAISVTINASADSLSSARASIVLRKDYLSRARHATNEMLPDECERLLANTSSAALYKITLDHFEETSRGKFSITFTAHADLSSFVIKTQESIYAPRCAFAGVDGNVLNRGRDTLALYFGRTSHATLNILLRKVAPPSAPDSTILDGSGTGTFVAVARPADSSGVRLTYEFRRFGKILRGEDKANYIQFVEDYLNTRNNMFIFRGRTP